MVPYVLLMSTDSITQQHHKTISLFLTTPFHPLLPGLMGSSGLVNTAYVMTFPKNSRVLPNVGLLDAMFSDSRLNCNRLMVFTATTHL